MREQMIIVERWNHLGPNAPLGRFARIQEAMDFAEHQAAMGKRVILRREGADAPKLDRYGYVAKSTRRA